LIEIPGRILNWTLVFKAIMRVKDHLKMAKVYLESERGIRILWGSECKRDRVASHDKLGDYLGEVDVWSLTKVLIAINKKLKRLGHLFFDGMVVVGFDLTHKIVPSGKGYRGVLARRVPGLDKEGKPKKQTVESYGICRAQVAGSKVPAWLGFFIATKSENEGALELLDRLIRYYGKRFIDVIVADALYCWAEFINTASEAGIAVVVRAKESLNLYKGEIRLLKQQPQQEVILKDGDLPAKIRELTDLTSWPEVTKPLRLLEIEPVVGETLHYLSTCAGSTESVARIARRHWEHENNGHHNMKTHWWFTHMPVRNLQGLRAWWTIFAIAQSCFYAFLWACVWRLGKPRDENALLVVERLKLETCETPLEDLQPLWSDSSGWG